MERTKELHKPSFNLTLFLVLIGTASFIGLFLPLLTQLNAQGQFLEGVGLFISGLGVLAPIGFGVYQIQQINLQQSEDKGNQVSIQIIENHLIQALHIQEKILRIENKLGPHEYLSASDFTTQQIKSAIPPIMADKTDKFLSEASRITNQIDFRRSVVRHFDKSSENLKYLAVEASNEVLNQLGEDKLKKRQLLEVEQRGPFYGDIYKYLMGWLKNSIEFDFPMPESRIDQKEEDRKLYIDTLENIRDNKIKDFGLTDERQESLVRRYLNILIERLSNS
jgi:hypothetical protein